MEIEAWVCSRLGEKRWQHVQSVAKKAMELARTYHLDVDKAYRAGLLHDVAKPLSPKALEEHARSYGLSFSSLEQNMPAILHAPVGSAMLEAMAIEKDPEVLEAVRFHTTGHPKMGDLAKIIYIADLIEDGRDFPGVDTLRALEGKPLNTFLFFCVRHTIQYLLERKQPIHPDSLLLYNELLERMAYET